MGRANVVASHLFGRATLTAGSEEIWPTLVKKFPSEDPTAVSEAVTTAVLANVIEVEDGHDLT